LRIADGRRKIGSVISAAFAGSEKVADPGAWERDLFDDGIEELAEYEAGAMSQVARWDRDPSRVDALLAQVAGGKTHAVTDALGSVYGMTDSTGAVQARYSYDAYGARTVVSEAVPTAWGFTGRRHDGTGQMYYRARYYEPGVGVFTSVDPLGAFAGPHGENTSLLPAPVYDHSFGNPVLYRDPLGKFKPWDHYDLTFGNAIVRGVGGRLANVMALATRQVDYDHFYDDSWHGTRGVQQSTSQNMRDLLGLLPGRCFVPEGPVQSNEAALIATQRRIVGLIAESENKMCTGDLDGAARSFGAALHPIQDLRAHRVRDDGPRRQATIYDHCRLNMDAPDYPELWEALFEADRATWFYVGSFVASARQRGFGFGR
jgi:RHS repeat-associated protein